MFYRSYKYYFPAFNYIIKTVIVNMSIMKRDCLDSNGRKSYGIYHCRKNLVKQMLHEGKGKDPRDTLSFKLKLRMPKRYVRDFPFSCRASRCLQEVANP